MDSREIEKKFWSPSITSQFMVCPIPYHLDTYRGCIYNCLYCFARDFVMFSRRNSSHKEFGYLVGNRAALLEKWIARTLNAKYDYSKAGEVALKERIPIKIGATADPFPYVESEHRITYDVLKVFEKWDYPLEIQTKNPTVLAGYSQDFKNPNWVIAVTLISSDERFLSVVEPNAPSAKERLKAIKTLTDEGKKAIVKIQPAIYPKILNDLPDLVKGIKESGCFGFNIEGLKIRISMSESEQELFKKISSYLSADLRGYDLRDDYKKNGINTGFDYEMIKDKKLEYINLAQELATQYGLKLYVADNHLGKLGCNDECCGTEVLRNYKKWGNNERTRYFGKSDNCSNRLGKCLVNFKKKQKDSNKTMDEVANKFLTENTSSQYLLHTSFMDNNRVYRTKCPTLTTPAGGGHLPYVIKSDGQEIKRIRRMTPVECCRFQGFPDDWVDGLSETQMKKCLGNAVSIPVVKAIGERLKPYLENDIR